MKPIGLAFKKPKPNSYSNQPGGELMIVHHCLNCGKIAANRIAGDDDSFAILVIFNDSLTTDTAVAIQAMNLPIRLLTIEDEEQVLRGLFGNNYSKFID
jgi:hypothetical protein